MRRTNLLSSPIIWLSAVRLGRFSDIVSAVQANDGSALRLVGSSERSRVSSQLLAAASWAGAAAGTAIGTALAAGPTAAGVASTGEAAATVAAAKAVLVAAIVGVWRRHRGDGIVALPRASLKLHDIHPWSCYVEGLVANFLLKVLIGLTPLELYLEFAFELAGVVLLLGHDEGGGD